MMHSCRYNIQCPNENYMLHYTVVRMNIEPPDASGHCLDFLRTSCCHNIMYYLINHASYYIGFNFNITGKNKISDLCGSHESLTDDVIHGYHGSHLTLEFRSNRIHSRGGFYVGIVCILPSTTVQPKIGYKGYGYKGSRYGYKGYGYKGYGYRLRSCSSPRGLRPRRGLTLRSTNKPTTAKEFFVRHSVCVCVCVCVHA